MNNREKAKAVQKKFNQRLGIYYGMMAAGVIVAAIGLMLWFRLPWIFFFMRAALRTLTTNVTPTAYSAQAPSRHTGDST